jgi:hypothetical protein
MKPIPTKMGFSFLSAARSDLQRAGNSSPRNPKARTGSQGVLDASTGMGRIDDFEAEVIVGKFV